MLGHILKLIGSQDRRFVSLRQVHATKLDSTRVNWVLSKCFSKVGSVR